MTITSPHNPRLKELRKLARANHRARTGLFAVEGEDLVLAASQAGRKPVEGFRAAAAPAGTDAGLGTPGGSVGAYAGFHEVEPAVLAAVSTLGSGTRVIAVYEQRWDAPAGPLCVYLHGVRDPGNVGAVLRGALAFGASSVALGSGCADPHSPKAVRASMGAIFAVKLARIEGVRRLPGERIALVAGAGRPLWELANAPVEAPPAPATHGDAPRAGQAGTGSRSSGDARPVTLLVGAERDGLPEEVVRACEHVAHIPIASESLNAAMAATVALYELTRRSIRVPE